MPPLAVLTLLFTHAIFAQRSPVASNFPPPVQIIVSDETGRSVADAQVVIFSAKNRISKKVDTDQSGRASLPQVEAGEVDLRVEKLGFYLYVLNRLPLQPGMEVRVALQHVQEFHESVEVTDAGPAIDPAKTASTGQLTNREIFTLPYPTTRDFRNVLPFVPGVVVDPGGQIHLGGSAGYEVYHQLDGFDVTHPVSGQLDLRVSPDSLRLIEVQNSRYSAQFGKGAGGVLRLETSMGDDRFRYSATNFTPGISIRKGITFENVSPRFTFSGPIRRGRAWWLEGLSTEYDTNIDKDLPAGRNQHPAWRVDSLSKIQFNPTPGNVLTASFLLNKSKAEHVGLSLFTPVESTTGQHGSAMLFSIRDSATLSPRTLLETGIAASEFRADSTPRGILPYVLAPGGASGSFFESTASRSRRYEGLANLYVQPVQWGGRHELQLGAGVTAIQYDQTAQRRNIQVVAQDGALQRLSTFTGPPRFGKHNLQVSGYAQDRWSPAPPVVVELGLRTDWDQIIRDPLLSPRLAATYLLGRARPIKLVGGVGVAHDATNLEFVTRALQGERLDQAFSSGTAPAGPPLVTSFLVDQRALKSPSVLNWSVGAETMLPRAVLLRLEFLEKRGRHGFAYVNTAAALAGIYELRSIQKNNYDGVQLSARKKFAGNHDVFMAYTRSTARSNAVLDFSLDNPIFAQQAGGRLPWDVPNHVVSWGWLPFTPWFEFAYSLDWHTGFPFNVVDQRQQIVGAPSSRRFPDFFTLNLHLEHRFRLRGREFAVRVGANNMTGRKNPGFINNNIDSPDFLMPAGLQHRAFTARIRLLGRK